MLDKHLAQGSTLPPFSPGKLRLYSMQLCPYAQRSRMVLNHKNIPHEIVNVNLRSKPDWFLERNTAVPVLEIEPDKKILIESIVIDYYLDEVYPENKLTPTDPYVKARHHVLEGKYGKVTTKYYKIVFGKEYTDNDLEEFYDALEPYEKELNGKFFGGDQISMLDIHMWPHLERNCLIKSVTGKDPIPKERFPKLNAWATNMQGERCVKETMTSEEIHQSFLNAIKSGKPFFAQD